VNAHHTEIQEQHTTNAYQSLADTTGLADPRWAFGGGSIGGVVEVDSALPEGVDPVAVAQYCLMLGDDALIYSHRLTEWLTNAPELEEEVALGNIALDLLGQARILLARAARAGARPAGAAASATPCDGEDRLAYWRSAPEFRCVRLVELDDELDFARCTARLLVFATWRLALLQGLLASADPVIAAVAAKGVKEVAYHRDYAVRWMLRLGDGTPDSHRRMQSALEWTWPYLDDLYRCSDTETRLARAGVAVDPSTLRHDVDATLQQVLQAATLARPEVLSVGTLAGASGRDGVHTEYFGALVAVMQELARSDKEATW
jgi:ring-1,2-phenylacetyl-CoA epoxidase subunit PaaC